MDIPEYSSIRQEATARRLEYGSDPDQFGDLYLAPDGGRGSILLFHGGFWRPHRGLEMTTSAAAALVALGWNVWNVEYRRPARIAWRDTLADCSRAARAFAGLVERFGLADTPRIVAGHSAGGHLAAWTFAHDTAEWFDGLATLNGVLDFGMAYREDIGAGAGREFVGAYADPTDIQACDPVTALPSSGPAVCLHSRTDERVPFRITASYVDKAGALNSPVELIEVPGHHTAVIEPDGPVWPLVTGALDRLADTIEQTRRGRTDGPDEERN